MISLSPTRLGLTGVVAAICSFSLASVFLTAIQASGTQADLQVSVAAAGIDEYNLDSSIEIAVEDFDDRDLISWNGEFNFSGDAGAFSGNGWIQEASFFGGAGGTGKHATANYDTIVLTMPGTSDYKYIGFWWSAGNAPNDVELVAEDGSIVTFSVNAGTENLQTHVGNCRANPGVTAYCGNPNFSNAVNDEPFAFVHLRYEPGFREVRFSGAGFEFDNVTVSMQVPDLDESETVLGGFVPFELTTAPVLIADPRASSLDFPGLELAAGAGEQDAMICFSQTDSEGGAISGEASIEAAGSRADVTRLTDTNLVAFHGARDDVEDFSGFISIESVTRGQRLGVNSVFIRVAATPDIGSGTNACTGDDAVFSIVEVRSLNILQSNSVNVSID